MVLRTFPKSTSVFFHLAARLKRRWKLTLLLALSLSSLLTWLTPIATVKGLVSPTPIPTADAMSMDANRIATLDVGAAMVSVYDIPSAAAAVFPAPIAFFSSTPQIYGNKIVIASSPGLLVASTLFYCVLPVPLAACGPWVALPVPALPTTASLAAWGFPVFHDDIVAWPVAGGLDYFSFHSGGVTAIPTAGVQPVMLSTNGDIISFVAGGTLQYVRTSDCIGPCVPAVVPTALPAAAGSATSISQNVIVFNEPGAPSLVRYLDLLTGIASIAGAGPVGTLGAGGQNSPAVWGDRIVFIVTEAALGFDCNGDAVIGGDRCLRYWNYRNPVALLLPAAAPPFLAGAGNRPFAIYDRYIAYLGPTGVSYVTVPMIGDIDYNGAVNILDIALAAFCFDQNIKSIVPPC